MKIHGRNINRWVCPVPYKGYTTTMTYLDDGQVERVAFSGASPDLTVDQFLETLEHEVELITDSQLDNYMMNYERSLITDPEPIDRDRFWEMLEVLPPCRWENGFFHVSERYTGDLVSWFLEVGDKYWEFRHLATISNDELAKIKKDCVNGKYSEKYSDTEN